MYYVIFGLPVAFGFRRLWNFGAGDFCINRSAVDFENRNGSGLDYLPDY